MIATVVPRLNEFQTKKFYEYFATDARIMSFLPDILDAKKLLNRKWVTTFICSLKPQQMIFTTLYGSNLAMKGVFQDLKSFMSRLVKNTQIHSRITPFNQ